MKTETCRWNKISAKKNQRVKAAQKTRKQPSLRKSVSVQVDITSSIIGNLQEDKKALLCRLTPRKAIQHLSRTASLKRIDQVAGMFLTKSGDRPSYEEFKRMLRRCRDDWVLCPLKNLKERARDFRRWKI
uniref:Uncharacterized protein n=1 Tax=Ditylenchus dipsaci TaxID=166011 RepID=A0A915CUJ5_9BILA